MSSRSTASPARRTGIRTESGTSTRAPESDIRELRRRSPSRDASASVEDLERAVRVYDAMGDRTASAKARFALGRALVTIGEAAGREILEDAGTCFEELGDEEAVLAVDAALRDADDQLEDSPRSFHAAYRRTDSSQWRTG